MTRVQRATPRLTKWIVPLAAALLTCAVAAAATRPATVATHETSKGKVLASAAGRTLYLFTADKNGKSSCYGSCASTWTPDLTTGRPAAASGSGVKPSLLGTTRRTDGRMQVTYMGHPLYLDRNDNAPGQVKGENANQFGGRWYVVNAAGNAVKPSSNSCPPGYRPNPSGPGCVVGSY
jgi:predicted lipoprotein with Yx(FWY)xxD motif